MNSGRERLCWCSCRALSASRRALSSASRRTLSSASLRAFYVASRAALSASRRARSAAASCAVRSTASSRLALSPQSPGQVCVGEQSACTPGSQPVWFVGKRKRRELLRLGVCSRGF